MFIQMGDYTIIKVLRITDIGYVLGDETQEIFLHMKQANRELEVGEKVEVFLYYDNQRRVTATMTRPIVDIHTPGFVDVVDQNFHLGVFTQIGLIKDLLLSRDDLPHAKKEWPQKGDRLFIRMRASKNQLTAKLMPRFEIPKYLKPVEALEVGKKYFAYNVHKTEEGQVFYTEEGHNIYVYFKHVRKGYRIGEKEEIKITIDKGEFRYNGTVIEQKEIMIDKDAEYLLMYLKSNRGEMPYGDKSDALEITERFRMSKGAFKRAIGTLYKHKFVTLEPERTMLIKKEDKPTLDKEVEIPTDL